MSDCRVTVLLKGTPFSCDVAMTPSEHALGLQKYASLAEDEGMLFVFPKVGTRVFHMAEVCYPIDILGLDAGSRVTKVVEGALPGTLERWTFPKVAAVLEVPGGTCRRLRVRVGDVVEEAQEKKTAQAKHTEFGKTLDLNSDRPIPLREARKLARWWQSNGFSADIKFAFSRFGKKYYSVSATKVHSSSEKKAQQHPLNQYLQTGTSTFYFQARISWNRRDYPTSAKAIGSMMERRGSQPFRATRGNIEFLSADTQDAETKSIQILEIEGRWSTDDHDLIDEASQRGSLEENIALDIEDFFGAREAHPGSRGPQVDVKGLTRTAMAAPLEMQEQAQEILRELGFEGAADAIPGLPHSVVQNILVWADAYQEGSVPPEMEDMEEWLRSLGQGSEEEGATEEEIDEWLAASADEIVEEYLRFHDDEMPEYPEYFDYEGLVSETTDRSPLIHDESSQRVIQEMVERRWGPVDAIDEGLIEVRSMEDAERVPILNAAIGLERMLYMILEQRIEEYEPPEAEEEEEEEEEEGDQEWPEDVSGRYETQEDLWDVEVGTLITISPFQDREFDSWNVSADTLDTPSGRRHIGRLSGDSLRRLIRRGRIRRVDPPPEREEESPDSDEGEPDPSQFRYSVQIIDPTRVPVNIYVDVPREAIVEEHTSITLRNLLDRLRAYGITWLEDVGLFSGREYAALVDVVEEAQEELLETHHWEDVIHQVERILSSERQAQSVETGNPESIYDDKEHGYGPDWFSCYGCGGDFERFNTYQDPETGLCETCTWFKDRNKKDPKTAQARSEVDEHAVTELRLYAENDVDLYDLYRHPIEKNLENKLRKGRYDPAKAPKAFVLFYTAGAKKYEREFGWTWGTWNQIFSKATRERAAEQYTREWEEHFLYEEGDIGRVRKKAKEMDLDLGDPQALEVILDAVEQEAPLPLDRRAYLALVPIHYGSKTAQETSRSFSRSSQALTSDELPPKDVWIRQREQRENGPGAIEQFRDRFTPEEQVETSIFHEDPGMGFKQKVGPDVLDMEQSFEEGPVMRHQGGERVAAPKWLGPAMLGMGLSMSNPSLGGASPPQPVPAEYQAEPALMEAFRVGRSDGVALAFSKDEQEEAVKFRQASENLKKFLKEAESTSVDAQGLREAYFHGRAVGEMETKKELGKMPRRLEADIDPESYFAQIWGDDMAEHAFHIEEDPREEAPEKPKKKAQNEWNETTNPGTEVYFDGMLHDVQVGDVLYNDKGDLAKIVEKTEGYTIQPLRGGVSSTYVSLQELRDLVNSGKIKVRRAQAKKTSQIVDDDKDEDTRIRRIIQQQGLPSPPEDIVIVSARYSQSQESWHVQAEDGRWFFYDVREGPNKANREWVPSGFGPTANLSTKKTAQIVDEAKFVEKASEAMYGKLDNLDWVQDRLNPNVERAVISRRDLARMLGPEARGDSLKYLLDAAGSDRGLNLLGDAVILSGQADMARVGFAGRQPTLILYRSSESPT